MSRSNLLSSKRTRTDKEHASDVTQTQIGDEPPSETARTFVQEASMESGSPDSTSGLKRRSQLKELRENEFKKNASRLSDFQKYFSRLDLSFVKGKSKVVAEGLSKKVLHLEAEKDALRSELAAASERIRALEAEILEKDSELGAARSKVGDDAGTISWRDW